MAEYKPVTLEEFPGLDLRGDPAANHAIDLLNVVPEYGQIKTRPGYGTFHTGPSNNYSYFNLALFRRSGGDQVLATRINTTGATTYELVAINSSGTTIATQNVGNVAAPAIGHFVRFGAPAGATTDERVYVGIDQTAVGVTTLYRWNGSTWSQPTATVDGVAAQDMPGGRFLAVTPWDQRLVNAYFHQDGAGPGASSSSVSYVYFSDPGKPEEWDTTNFLQFGPGDGEPIMGVATWRDLLFVFKKSRYWVVYGTSTDSTGGAIFNYREVNSGVGLYASQAIAVGGDGLYFLDQTGVYRTTGGIPQRVSQELDPLFSTEAGVGDDDLPYFRAFAQFESATTSRHLYSLCWRNGRLLLSVPARARTTGTGSQYVFERTLSGSWVVHDLPAAHIANGLSTASAERLAFASSTNEKIYYLDPSLTTDAGSAITSRYRTGFLSPAGVTTPSTVREVLLEGTGTVDVKASADYGDLGSAASVSLGTSPAVAQNRAVAANYGRFHSYEISAPSGAWTVNRATLHVESKATPGKQP